MRLILLGMALMICFSFAPWSAQADERLPVFQLSPAQDKYKQGDELQLAVIGDQLADVYAFEVRLAFDSAKLRFKRAESGLTGFSIPVIQQGDELLFASTKTGSVAGDSERLTLCTFYFEAAQGGQAQFKLSAVKLVDSGLKYVDYENQAAATLAIGPVQFSDIAGHWAEQAIMRALELNLIQGYEDGTFRPDAYVTRGEFAALLARALKLPANGDAAGIFTDYGSMPEWVRPYVSALANANMAEGYEDGTFRPAADISRAEMTAIVMRKLRAAADMQGRSTFDDADEIPEWAQGWIAAAQEDGIVDGRGNNRFEPQAFTTRAEAVTLLLRLLDRQ